jgi:hypothetical protein
MKLGSPMKASRDEDGVGFGAGGGGGGRGWREVRLIQGPFQSVFKNWMGDRRTIYTINAHSICRNSARLTRWAHA